MYNASDGTAGRENKLFVDWGVQNFFDASKFLTN